MIRLLCLVIGYVFGMIQTGYFVGRYHRTDIRKHGSGNAGTTNALRTFGKKAGLITLVGDLLKSLVAILLITALFQEKYSEMLNLLALYTGVGCVLGHNFPCYLKFKGGKGIATSMGMVFALDYRVGIGLAVLFLIIVLTTHYVSLGSILCYAAGVVAFILLVHTGIMPLGSQYWIEMDVVLVLLLCLAVYRHRANISRLLKGKENKTYLGGHKPS